MLAEEKAAASRFFAIMAGLIGAAAALSSRSGCWPRTAACSRLKPWLAALAATVANALCLPFVAGYWHTAGKRWRARAG